MVPRWFVYLGGFSLLVLGALLIQQRPRQPGDSLYRRYVNFGTLWALCCIGMGGLLLALALGYLGWPGRASPPPSSRPTFRAPR